MHDVVWFVRRRQEVVECTPGDLRLDSGCDIGGADGHSIDQRVAGICVIMMVSFGPLLAGEEGVDLGAVEELELFR